MTFSIVVVEVGNHADAVRTGDYRLEAEAAPEAFARIDYQLGPARLTAGLDDEPREAQQVRSTPIANVEDLVERQDTSDFAAITVND